MKKIFIATISCIAAISAVSCMNDEAPDAYLGVSLDQDEYKAGTPVTFCFEGDPDNIVFYSGENGHRYENRHRTEADCSIYFDFSTQVRSGDIKKNLKVYLSTDFSGIYDAADVQAAEWTDISDCFRFSTGQDNFPSGELMLDRYLENIGEEGIFFIAFRYTGNANQWIIRSSDVDIMTPENVRTVMADMSSIGWRTVDCGNPEASWDFNGSRLYFNGNVNADDNDDWAISTALHAKKVDPDKGTALKNLSTRMNQFTYTYNEPGTYRAVFETSSVWYSGGSHSISEIEVKITGEGSGQETLPYLTVSTDKTTCQAGENIVFSLSGEGASEITFWSGESGHDFQFKDSFDRSGDLAISFTSYVRYGIIYDNLKILVSNDFNGIYDTENVSSATWTDLSDQFIFSEGKDKTESGEIMLNAYLAETGNDDPAADIYMAFRYTDNTDNSAKRQNNWIIRTFNVDAISPAGVRSNIGTMSGMGWEAVDFANESTGWTISSSQILIDGKTGDPNDDWCISKSFKRLSGPDTGETAELGTFTHTFSSPGTYNTVFDWYDGKNWRQEKLTITVI